MLGLRSSSFISRLPRCFSSISAIRRTFCSDDGVATRHLELSNGNSLAYRALQGDDLKNPGVVFCPGFQSNMTGVKAMALEMFCKKKDLSYLRFDYEGCGESSGDLQHVTFTDWYNNVLTVLDQLTAGPQILVGSSMGGWLSLLAALDRPHRVHAILGIATAADFPQRKFSSFPEEAVNEMKVNGFSVCSVNDSTFVLTQKFLDSVQSYDILSRTEIDINCPVRLLHGMKDESVSFSVSMDVAKKISSRDVHVLLQKDGQHRFSQPDDIELLFETLSYLAFGVDEVRQLALKSWKPFSIFSSPDRMIEYSNERAENQR